MASSDLGQESLRFVALRPIRQILQDSFSSLSIPEFDRSLYNLLVEVNKTNSRLIWPQIEGVNSPANPEEARALICNSFRAKEYNFLPIVGNGGVQYVRPNHNLGESIFRGVLPSLLTLAEYLRVRTEAGSNVDLGVALAGIGEPLKPLLLDPNLFPLKIAVWSTYLCEACSSPQVKSIISDLEEAIRVVSIFQEAIRIQVLEASGTSNRPMPSERIKQFLMAAVIVPEEVLPTVAAQDRSELLVGELPIESPRYRSLGVAELKVVRQQLLKYTKGEIAHIENIVAGEKRSRTHNRTDRVEDLVEITEESSNVRELDLQTTDRSELSVETSRIQQDEQQLQYGVSGSGTYGAWTISAHMDSSSSVARSEAEKHSQRYARDIVNRSVEKVSKSIRETRSRKTTTEVQEINLHEFANANLDKNIAGVYRWVDKWYLHTVYTYGMRWLIEFLIPDPASRYKKAVGSWTTSTTAPSDDDKYEKLRALVNNLVPAPTIGGVPLVSPDQIQRQNYLPLLNLYPETEKIDVPLADPIHVGTTFQVKHEGPQGNNSGYSQLNGEIEVPANYAAMKATLTALAWRPNVEGRPFTDSLLTVHVGNNIRQYVANKDGAQFIETVRTPDNNAISLPNGVSFSIDSVLEKVPVLLAVEYFGGQGCTVHFILECNLTVEAFKDWQNKVFAAIQAAYSKERERATSLLSSQAVSAGSSPVDNSPPPTWNKVEQTELKRQCLRAMMGRKVLSTIDDVTAWDNISFESAYNHGKEILFFEQAFEWEQLASIYFPRFWIDDNLDYPQASAEPMFQRFLDAGFARVVVPVRPTYHDLLMGYFQSQQIWRDTPIIGDQHYVSIVEALKEMEDAPDEGIPGESWEVKLPTSLVILDDIGREPKLPDFSADLNRFTGDRSYQPSILKCYNEHYDMSLWPDDGVAILSEYRSLGYLMPNSGDPIADMSEQTARDQIRLFQHVIKRIKPELRIRRTGLNDPCTLVALTFARQLRLNSEWPGPQGPPSI